MKIEWAISEYCRIHFKLHFKRVKMNDQTFNWFHIRNGLIYHEKKNGIDYNLNKIYEWFLKKMQL